MSGRRRHFERRHAFLSAGPEMVLFLQRIGVRFVFCRGYSDYYSSAKGGHDIGRGIEPVPFDGRILGTWLDKLQPGLAQSLGLAVMTNEARSLSHYNRSMRMRSRSRPRVVLRTVSARLRRQALLTNGASLIAQMLSIAHLPRDLDLDRSTARGSDRRGRRVSSASDTTRSGAPKLIHARQGVLLASGGFAHNPEMREEFGGTSRTAAGGPSPIPATPVTPSGSPCGWVRRST